MKSVKLVETALSLAVLFIALGARPGGFRLARQIRLGDRGGWDALAVEPATQRLFVTHGTHVQVLDVKSDSVVGDIPNTPGAHGVALAPDLGRGFVSDGRDSTVTVFDRASVVARHQRAVGKGVKVLELDHYLEILLRKPGALPGATALAQARASGVFTATHDAFWARTQGAR